MAGDSLASLIGGAGEAECSICGRKDCDRIETRQNPDYPLLPQEGRVRDEAPKPENAKRGRRTRHHPGPAEDR